MIVLILSLAALALTVGVSVSAQLSPAASLLVLLLAELAIGAIWPFGRMCWSRLHRKSDALW